MAYNYINEYGPQEGVLWTGKGQAIAGAAIGIIVLDIRYPLIPGNVANATTWKFPVLYKILEGAGKEVLEADNKLGERVIDAARELEQQGVGAIVASCGYFGHYQVETAAATDTPVFLSSLVQVPLIVRSLKKGQKLGLICAVEDALNDNLLQACGIMDRSKLAIAGIQNLPEFKNILDSKGHFDNQQLERELVQHAVGLIEKHPEVGAIMLECSDLPPYASAIQKATQRPVFDFTTLVNWVYSSVVRVPFAGSF